jgi:chorismate mutase/prephenate dehydratase
VNSPLRICGEVVLRIHQNLLCNDDHWQQVTKVYSHAQSLAQCRYWLDKNLPHAERIACSSNAEAARKAASESSAAAIGSVQAAPIYGLQVVQTSIEDNTNNTTRFLVVGHQDVGQSGQDKTSLLLSMPNRPGSLYNLLKPFAEFGIDMTRIESRPARSNNWEYLFFVDIRGHVKDTPIQNALQTLQGQVDLVRVLGSYPVAVM